MSIFDVPISFYKNVFDKAPDPPRILLSAFLKSQKKSHVLTLKRAREFYAEITAPEGTPEHREQVKRYKAEKGKLPAATIAGVTRYAPPKNMQGGSECEMIQYSGFMQLDIDGKDNPDYTPAELFEALKTLPHAAYVGRSVSGEGLFVLLRISDPTEYALHYKAAIKGLQPFGINIDPNANSPYQLRFIAPDPEAFFNEAAPVFTHKAAPAPAPQPKTSRPVKTTGTGTRHDPALLCIEYIERTGTDITEGVTTWLRIASALHNEYGEAGRELFHRISRYHPKYTERETDQVFTNAASRNNGTGIGYFMAVCKSAGISAKELIRDKSSTRPPSIPQPRAEEWPVPEEWPAPDPKEWEVPELEEWKTPIEWPVPELEEWELPEWEPFADGLLNRETGEIIEAAHGFNPYTGEIFDQRGYPANWDDVTPPREGTPAFFDMLKAEREAGAITEAEFTQQAARNAARMSQSIKAISA